MLQKEINSEVSHCFLEASITAGQEEQKLLLTGDSCREGSRRSLAAEVAAELEESESRSQIVFRLKTNLVPVVGRH